VNVGNAPGGGGPVLDNFYLAHVWYGLVSALSIRRGPVSLDIGAHVSDYHREHAMAVRPLFTAREYTNVGFKQEQSGFAKAAWDAGAFRFSADLQVRRAAFRYQPSANAGVAEASTSWTFVNPKAGISWHASGGARPLTLFASFGRTSREPSRGDLFAGADDLNSGNAASILPLSRIHAESVNDFEAGASWMTDEVTFSGNVFAMEFRNEIAPIGELSLTGSPLRQSVPASYRRGVELDGSWRASSRVRASANLTVMKARILAYPDASSGLTYVNVEPLLTPPVMANAQVEIRLTDALMLTPTARYVDRSYLANDGDARFTVPSYGLLDLTLAWHSGPVELRAQLFNALDANAYAAGYHDGANRYFYPIASRNVLLGTKFSV
jgi:iron complex outermembrane receptor protein